MNKSNERSILTKLLRKLKNSPTPIELRDLNKSKKIRKELDESNKKFEKAKKELELKIEELILQETLGNLDPDFDKKLECLLKTPPLKLKDLKEQLKKEREGKQGSH